MILVSVRTRPSNYPGDKYKNNINSGVFLVIGHRIQYKVRSAQWHYHQRFRCSGGLRVNQGYHINNHSVCIWLYLFLEQGCQEAVPDFIQEYNIPFCEMTEDSFDFHIVKIPTIWHEINSLENSLQPSFNTVKLTLG